MFTWTPNPNLLEASLKKIITPLPLYPYSGPSRNLWKLPLGNWWHLGILMVRREHFIPTPAPKGAHTWKTTWTSWLTKPTWIEGAQRGWKLWELHDPHTSLFQKCQPYIMWWLGKRKWRFPRLPPPPLPPSCLCALGTSAWLQWNLCQGNVDSSVPCVQINTHCLRSGSGFYWVSLRRVERSTAGTVGEEKFYLYPLRVSGWAWELN